MELERENRKLRRQLEQAEVIIDIQKKLRGSWRSRWTSHPRGGAIAA
jgi:hypothetical protein